MGYTFGSAIFFLLVLVIISFFLGLMFFGRLKIIRNVLWTVSGLLLLLTIATGISQSLDDQNSQLVGKYKLDLVNSKFSSLDLKKFSNLTLTVKDDNTFIINRPTPFFPSQAGRWEHTDDGDLAFTKCSFSDNTKFTIMDGIGTWTFESYNLVNGVTSDKIIFNVDLPRQ